LHVLLLALKVLLLLEKWVGIYVVHLTT